MPGVGGAVGMSAPWAGAPSHHRSTRALRQLCQRPGRRLHTHSLQSPHQTALQTCLSTPGQQWARAAGCQIRLRHHNMRNHWPLALQPGLGKQMQLQKRLKRHSHAVQMQLKAASLPLPALYRCSQAPLQKQAAGTPVALAAVTRAALAPRTRA